MYWFCHNSIGKACRGIELDDGVKNESNESQYEEDAKNTEDENNMRKIPVEADFLYSFSTAPGLLHVLKMFTWYW